MADDAARQNVDRERLLGLADRQILGQQIHIGRADQQTGQTKEQRQQAGGADRIDLDAGMGSLYAGQRRQQAWHVIQEAVDQKLGQIARLPDDF